ncbi:MAG: hypothetical protein RLP14_05850 [Owenweeksia sp.]
MAFGAIAALAAPVLGFVDDLFLTKEEKQALGVQRDAADAQKELARAQRESARYGTVSAYIDKEKQEQANKTWVIIAVIMAIAIIIAFKA